MNKKCPQCGLVNFGGAKNCVRCSADLTDIKAFYNAERTIPKSRKVLKRFAVLIFAILFTIGGFYLSLIFSAEKLTYEQKQTVQKSVITLAGRGFSRESFLLNYLTAFRKTDNWLNASVEKENAYAATNFPFEIMTIYPDFFTVPLDDTERAAVLLHEAQHLNGADEKEAYKYVWENRKTLGWTKEKYGDSVLWRNVRKQTKEYLPEIFVCEQNEYADCTE